MYSGYKRDVSFRSVCPKPSSYSANGSFTGQIGQSYNRSLIQAAKAVQIESIGYFISIRCQCAWVTFK